MAGRGGVGIAPTCLLGGAFCHPVWGATNHQNQLSLAKNMVLYVKTSVFHCFETPDRVYCQPVTGLNDTRDARPATYVIRLGRTNISFDWTTDGTHFLIWGNMLFIACLVARPELTPVPSFLTLSLPKKHGPPVTTIHYLRAAITPMSSTLNNSFCSA